MLARAHTIAVIDFMASHKGSLSLAMRRKLAAKAFSKTAAYDTAIR